MTPLIIDTGSPSFGVEHGPGNWSGAIGMLIREEAEVLVGQYTNSPTVFPYVQFSTYTSASHYRILSGPPNKISKHVSSFLSSVNNQVWAILGVSWILISLCSYAMARFEEKAFDRNLGTQAKLSNCLLSFYGLLFERGFDFLPESTSRRLVLAGWLILSEVLMTCVAGVFASKLAVLDVPERIDSIEDLLNFPNICPYLTKGLSVDSYLKYSNKAVHKEIWRRIEKCDGNWPMADLLYDPKFMYEVGEGRSVIMANTELAIAAIASADCMKHSKPLYVGKEPFLAWPFVYVYRRNLPADLSEKLYIATMRYVECGYLLGRRPLGQNLDDADACFDLTAFYSTSISAMNLKSLSKLFQLWAMGLCVSLAGLVLETTHFYFFKDTFLAKEIQSFLERRSLFLN